MAITWILVANDSTARILTLGERWDNLDLAAQYSFPATAAGKDGSTTENIASGGPSGDEFATVLASALKQGRLTGRYDDLVLVAMPELLARLRAAMDDSTLGRVTYQFGSNLFQLSPDQLNHSLQALMNP